MEVRSIAKYVRMAPLKVRLVANLVRGLDLVTALDRLAVVNKKGVHFIAKLIHAARADAKNNFELEEKNLFIKEIKVDGGPILYRWMPKAHGRATKIRKRTSNITVVLAEKNPTPAKASKRKSKIDTVKVDAAGGPEPIETVGLEKKDKISQDVTAAHKEILDQNVRAGFRGAMKQERTQKKEKGFFKKMFNRKSGM